MTSPAPRAQLAAQDRRDAIAAALVVGSRRWAIALAQAHAASRRAGDAQLRQRRHRRRRRAMSAILRQQFVVDPRVRARSRSTARSR
jgi:hypothetical protein